MSSTRISQHINAPCSAAYRALLDPRAVATWKMPTGMTCHVHAFDAREGGAFRISLRYDDATRTGKTTAHTDAYRGRFAKLGPNERVVEVDEFETDDPALRGEMTIAITLADADGGTNLLAVHDGPPPGGSATENETGWRMALAKLAAFVEAGGYEPTDADGNVRSLHGLKIPRDDDGGKGPWLPPPRRRGGHDRGDHLLLGPGEARGAPSSPDRASPHRC
jgi:uncharacterized protein YndB with AHSA1/START domain